MDEKLTISSATYESREECSKKCDTEHEHQNKGNQRRRENEDSVTIKSVMQPRENVSQRKTCNCLNDDILQYQTTHWEKKSIHKRKLHSRLNNYQSVIHTALHHKHLRRKKTT